MAIIKCKMCGGDLNITEGVSVAECEYCGTKQTVPNVDSEKKTSLFLRAEKLRRECDFDRAAAIYDSIITDFPAEPEAYWGLLLCKYGIEYVDDPATGKKIPTCHRSSFDSVMEDENLEKVLDCADTVARKVYRNEAKAIEEIRKGILEVSGKEPPYDIFICYKETDENGERSIDSVLAQDVYDALTEKGYRVFFSRITLEDKLGTEYEPYIFAALNSAKVMLVFGTDYEYFNAVWVKNEWSRYLKLIAQDKTKHLIPCYKDVDAYDMPKEFQKLQAQDLGKVGAVQDLLRGINKLLGRTATVQSGAGGPTAVSLLERAQMFLDDKSWGNAREYFDKVLDIDPKCAQAYMGKFCASRQYCQIAEMIEDGQAFSEEAATLWKRALEFASPELRAHLEGYLTTSEKRKQEKAAEAAKQSELDKTRLSPIISAAQGLLSASDHVTVGLKSDGTVVATGSNMFRECDVSDWRDIVAISARNGHTVGLKSDGTVVATGSNVFCECDVSDWRNIVAVSAGDGYTVGLKSGGTVVTCGGRGVQDRLYFLSDIRDWRDIVAVSAGDKYTIGLKSDGTVVVKGCKFNVSDWRNIVAVSAGNGYTVGLKSDGTVVATGLNSFGQCNVSDWRDIVAVSAGDSRTVGLKANGTVVAAGLHSDGACNVSDWRDIVAIAAGRRHTVGLKSDGTVVAAGSDEDGLCSVENWKLFDDLLQERQAAQQRRREEAEQRRKEEEERLRQEEARRQEEERARQEAERRRQEEECTRRKAQLEQEQTQRQTELANLKGLFTGKRRKEIEARLAEIEAELKKL